MEPRPRLELGTPSLPWKCSTTELTRRRIPDNSSKFHLFLLHFVSVSPADIAQWLERLFCKQRVVGSNPSVGSTFIFLFERRFARVYKKPRLWLFASVGFTLVLLSILGKLCNSNHKKSNAESEISYSPYPAEWCVIEICSWDTYPDKNRATTTSIKNPAILMRGFFYGRAFSDFDEPARQ